MNKQISAKQELIMFRTEHTEFCNRARQLEESGEYENAAIALDDIWRGVGVKPKLKNFPNALEADILVRIGTLTGWLGSAGQIEGAQERAKDLISAGIHLYEEVDDIEKIADSQSELGVCYWREGAFDEAENFFTDALEKAPQESFSLRGKIMLKLVNTAISKREYDVAISVLREAESVIKSQDDQLLKGKLHFNQALISKLLYEENGDLKLAEKAVDLYFEASSFYRKANSVRFEAIVENNLGELFLSINKLKDAHLHLDKAINLFTISNDFGRLASVFDTKARVFLAEKQFADAERFARKSVSLFMRGDEYFSLAESLTTLGTIFARQKAFADAKESFERAIGAAEFMNDSVNLGLALLAQIEELKAVLSAEERTSLYSRTVELLGDSKQASIISRLKNAELICQDPNAKSKWDDFVLSEKVLDFEAKYIRDALSETGGRVTKAAELLGLSHQNLSLLLKSRHIDLASAKRPRKKRSDRKRKSRKKI